MKTFIKTLILLLSIFLSNNQITIAQCHIDDWTALKALYDSTNGDNWTNRLGWDILIDNQTIPPADCDLRTLFGVFTENGRVTCLDLDGVSDCDFSNTANGNNLDGPIPPELGLLQNLKYLRLTHNNLNGDIPPEIGDITSLIHIFFNFNNLTGNIPSEIGNLSELEIFDARHNSLDGEIPLSFSNLTKLKVLTFSSNSFEGDVLEIVVNLSNIEYFNASENRFTGNIPSSIANLTQLKEISLQNNQFSGTLSSQLGEFDELSLITLGNNQFTGCFPNSMTTYCNLDVWTNSNEYLSDGNNFDATWEDFCATGAGTCCASNGCTDQSACNYNPDATCDDGSCLEICSTDLVYPGDLNHDGIVNHQDMGLSGLYLYETGPERADEHQVTEWDGYPANNWNRQQLNNEDIKHFDCNGDGVITDTDHQAVEDNMGRTWTEQDAFNAPSESDYQVLLLPADQVSDDYMFLNISLERRAGGDLNVRGGHFTIDYSSITADIKYVTLGLYKDSWLGDRDEDLFYEINDVFNERKYEIGFTKTDNLSSTGNGIIGKLIIELENDLNFTAKKDNNMFEISINTIGTHNGSTFTPIENQLLQIDVNGNNCQSNLIITENTPFQNTYKSSNTIETQSFVLVGASQQVEYKASDRITLNCGFRVKKDASFSAEIVSCN